MFLHTYNKQVKYSIKITFNTGNRNVSNFKNLEKYKSFYGENCKSLWKS